MATIHDVAQAAGVSSTTVSRYLNRRIELPPTTTVRIDAAVHRLGYRPNIMARRLSTGRTEAIGLVTPDIREPFFAELASVVEDEADRHGYTIFLSSTRRHQAREVIAINRLDEGHVDGIIMLTGTPDDGTLAKLIGTRRNVVLVDEDIPGIRVPRLFVENDEGAFAATQHLIEAGHRSIAFVGGPDGLSTALERKHGYLRALRQHGLTVRDDLIRVGSYQSEFAKQAVYGMVTGKRPPTAVFAACDSLALGTIMGLRAAGLSIPGDVSLVSFDDGPLPEVMQPPLTVVRQPIEALGRRAFQTLFALLNGRTASQIARLPVDLISRSSVAPPRQKGSTA